MKIEMSYELRGAKISSSISNPEPTVANLTKTIKHLAWVAGQGSPEITIHESNLQD